MSRAHFLRLALVAGLVVGALAGSSRAGGINVTNNTDVNQIVAALLAGGSGGITVTNAVLNAQDNGAGAQSSGTFTTSGPNNYKLSGSGIFLSSGNATQDGTSGAVIPSVTTNYGTTATAAQFALLTQVSPAASFHDVTELTITFTAGPTTSQVFFNGVFGSAEYPHFVGTFVDGFGLFLNGTNIAFADGQPVNIDSTDMVNTNFASDPTGNPGDAFQETPMQGLLVQQNGNPVITFSGSVTPGSTGNTLTFIVADANDNILDTGIYLGALGNTAPVPTPEPASLTLLGLGVAGLGLRALKRRVTA
jgi:hypothetical protein